MRCVCPVRGCRFGEARGRGTEEGNEMRKGREEGTEKEFARKDNLVMHLRRMHKMGLGEGRSLLFSHFILSYFDLGRIETFKQVCFESQH